MEDLRSGIEHLKQAKAHMSEANGIMNGHISKLKALEEENAELKAELADWKGNAEGFQPDTYMKLPLDADGEPIRIGDVVYVNPGVAWMVVGLRMSKFGWKVEMNDVPFLCEPDDLTHKKPEPDDSWEKLEEDMMRGTSCRYFGGVESALECCDCPHGTEQTGTPCWKNERIDILKRVKKLAKAGEEA